MSKNEWPDDTDYGNGSGGMPTSTKVVIIISIIVALLLALSIYNDVSADESGGIIQPTVNVTTTCTGMNVTISEWLVDPSLGDEWAWSHEVTKLHSGILNTQDGDELVVYGGSADWLIDKFTYTSITVEVTSELYRSESVAQSLVETISIPIDTECYSVGLVRNVNMIPYGDNGTSWIAYEKETNIELAQVTIARDEHGQFYCDEVVDVTILGGTYITALDWYCNHMVTESNKAVVYTVTATPTQYHYQANAFNTGNDVGYVTIIQLDGGQWWCSEVTVKEWPYTQQVNNKCLQVTESLNNNTIYIPAVFDQ